MAKNILELIAAAHNFRLGQETGRAGPDIAQQPDRLLALRPTNRCPLGNPRGDEQRAGLKVPAVRDWMLEGAHRRVHRP
jgi:hypothetical protein